RWDRTKLMEERQPLPARLSEALRAGAEIGARVRTGPCGVRALEAGNRFVKQIENVPNGREQQRLFAREVVQHAALAHRRGSGDFIDCQGIRAFFRDDSRYRLEDRRFRRLALLCCARGANPRASSLDVTHIAFTYRPDGRLLQYSR